MRVRHGKLRRIKYSWNFLFGFEHTKKGIGKKILSHWVFIERKRLNVSEKENAHKDGLKNITIHGDKILHFPVDSYKEFVMWGALSGENCDGIVMSEDINGNVSVELLELKSTFDTSDYLKAWKQIIVSLQKLFLLLNCIPIWKTIKVDIIRGVVFSFEPDVDSMVWIKQMEMLPKESWRNEDKFGLSLAINKSCVVSVPDNINIPGLPTKINLQRVWCTSDSCNDYTIGITNGII